MSPEPQDRFLWIAPEMGNPGLLLGWLWARGPGGPAEAAAELAIHPRTAERWADALIDAGHAVLVGGHLRPLTAPHAGRRSPIPWEVVASRLSPEAKRAAAELFRDAVIHPSRPGVRSDEERAKAAGLARRTIVRTRAVLAGMGFCFVTIIKRCAAGVMRLRRWLWDGRSGRESQPHGTLEDDVLRAEAAICLIGDLTNHRSMARGIANGRYVRRVLKGSEADPPSQAPPAYRPRLRYQTESKLPIWRDSQGRPTRTRPW